MAGPISQAQRQEVPINGASCFYFQARRLKVANKTPLHDWHVHNQGKMVEFAGWDLPVMYADGLIAEHLACRKYGGLFDISHMGRFLVSGPKALAFLQHTLTNSAASLETGQAQYTLISNAEGVPLDDAFLYRQAEETYLLVVNAANKDKDWKWLKGLNQDDAVLEDKSLELAMIALQGPRAEELLAKMAEGELPPKGRNNAGFIRLMGQEVFTSRTGYTGEPMSFELFVPWRAAVDIWNALADQGAKLGIKPVGLGARDTLRLEASLPLYGHEYSQSLPLMSMPLARFGVDLDGARDFVGKAALLKQAGGLDKKVVCIAAISKGMMREGSPILVDGQEMGRVTSGTTVPAWRFENGAPGDESYNRAIGLALVDSGLEPGQKVDIQYRKKTIPGLVVKYFARQKKGFLVPEQF
jgi:aminomethyltransferase